MNNFIYDIPTKVYFGKDQLDNLAFELKKYGKRVLLAYGGGSIKKIGLYDKIVNQIKSNGLELYELSSIEPNPRVESVKKGADICKQNKIDVVLAVGGGSTIDCSKWICASACVEHDPWEFFSKLAPVNNALPLITVLTLSATGSEMDAGGVISNTKTNDKMGRFSPLLQPKVSFLDPTNTFTVSRYQTACGSADILSHVMETYFSLENNMFMLDCFMEGLMKTVIKYTPIAIENPNDYEARANLMWASSWAINGFIKKGSQMAWSCHPMEHQLSAYYDITHGLGLAILTPRWLEYVVNEKTLPRIVQFGVNVFGIDKNLDSEEIAKKSIAMLSEFLFNTIGLDDTFTKIGITSEHFSDMAKKACGKVGVINGFVPLKEKDVIEIYKKCL